MTSLEENINHKSFQLTKGVDKITVWNKTTFLVLVIGVSLAFNGIIGSFIIQRYGIERIAEKGADMLGFSSPDENNNLADAEAQKCRT
jgi:hypothetical protein